MVVPAIAVFVTLIVGGAVSRPDVSGKIRPVRPAATDPNRREGYARLRDYELLAADGEVARPRRRIAVRGDRIAHGAASAAREPAVMVSHG